MQHQASPCQQTCWLAKSRQKGYSPRTVINRAVGENHHPLIEIKSLGARSLARLVIRRGAGIHEVQNPIFFPDGESMSG